MIFQEVLAEQDSRVKPLRSLIDEPDLPSVLADHWTYILDNIDYKPIFAVSRDLLRDLPANSDVSEAIRYMGKKTLEIVGERAALRHDLMGRIFHRLLLEAKYLGTYYTSIPAATLLLKTALRPAIWEIDWKTLDEDPEFRVGDFACGTGTLLMAAAESIVDNFVEACGVADIMPRLRRLHRNLMENTLYGYDVVPSALHLTASTLALRSPDVSFNKTHLYCLPLGSGNATEDARLGSIEFLERPEIEYSLDLFGLTATSSRASSAGLVGGSGDTSQDVVVRPTLDLCVMNPPFTRSAGGNLLFGSLPSSQRAEMQKKLREISQRSGSLVNSTAGLGSVFVAVGDKAVKEGGRIALILPKALLSGIAWSRTRQLLARKYELETLMVSHDPERWNFSENTDLGEVMLVARKRLGGENGQQGDVTCVNLWHNPHTGLEALGVANAIEVTRAANLAEGQDPGTLVVGGRDIGQCVSVASRDLVGLPTWLLPCSFAQSELARVAYSLVRGHVRLPRSATDVSIPLCPLGDVVSLGPDRRDVHDAFRLASHETNYPALWGHSTETDISMVSHTNAYLEPLSVPAAGRKLRAASDIWPRSGQLMVAERLRLNTARVVCTLLDRSALSNVWWPAELRGGHDDSLAKCLLTWINSTLGLLSLLVYREETEGAWVSFKKPMLELTPVLDVRKLKKRQKLILSSAFDRMGSQELLTLPHIAQDDVRSSLDSAIEEALGLDGLADLRSMLSREPVISQAPL
jgi:hypothetical protein